MKQLTDQQIDNVPRVIWVHFVLGFILIVGTGFAVAFGFEKHKITKITGLVGTIWFFGGWYGINKYKNRS